MATKGYIFEYDEKTNIDIDIDMDMDIVVEKEKNVSVFFSWNILFFLKNLKFQKLVKCFRRWKVTNFFLFDESFNRRNITPTNFSPLW